MLQFERLISTVDAHTAGEPFRVITSGLPRIPGATILEKRRAMAERFDHLRTFLMLEPRGHSGMYGCVVTEPNVVPEGEEEADFGVLFLHNEGYSTMCGHGIIAITKVAVETGLVEVGQEDRILKIDAPCGRIVSQAIMNRGRCVGVEFKNVPSFVYARDISVGVDGIGEVKADISYGGAFYVYVDAAKLGVEVVPAQIDRLVRLGMEIKHQAMAAYKVVHPEEEDLGFIYGTIIMEPYQEVDGTVISKNVCIFADGQIDRSPTGSGTSGRLALMKDQGIIREGQKFINKSVIDTEMTGRIYGRAKVGDFEAVLTRIGGTAQIMGFNQLVLEPDDPLPDGFRISGG